MLSIYTPQDKRVIKLFVPRYSETHFQAISISIAEHWQKITISVLLWLRKFFFFI